MALAEGDVLPSTNAPAEGATAPAPAPVAAPAPAADPAPADAAPAAPEADASADPNTPTPPAGDAGSTADATTVGSAGACSDRVKDYVVAGSLTSRALGARTWSLSRLAKAAAKDSDSCAKELYSRAVKEEQAYWNHIRDKFKCAGTDGKLAVSDTCSEHLLDEVKQSLDWLKLFKFAEDPADAPGKTEATVCDEKCQRLKASQPLNASTQKSLRETVRAVTAGLPDTKHVNAKPAPVCGPFVVPPRLKKGQKPPPPGPDGLTPNQEKYYNRFKANPRGASDLKDRIQTQIEDQRDIAAAAEDKVQIVSDRIATQACLNQLLQESADLSKAFEHLSASANGGSGAARPAGLKRRSPKAPPPPVD